MQTRTLLLTGVIATTTFGLGACSKSQSSAVAAPHAKRLPLKVVQGKQQTVGQAAAKAVPDATITQQVKDRLAGDKGLGKSDIHVKTEKGVVFLTGKANSKLAKKLAGKIASRIQGVRVVVNELTAGGS